MQLYNDAYIPALGGANRHPAALGVRAQAFWTGAMWDVVGPQLDEVLATGEATWHEDQAVALPRDGGTEQTYWTYSYTPTADDAGRVAGVLVIAQETTAHVLAERALRTAAAALAAERERLERVIAQAPVAMYLATGRAHVFEVANPAWYALVGKRPEEVLGRPARAVFPDLVPQGIFEIIERAYDTGAPYVAEAIPLTVDADGDGVPEEHFYNLVYQPLRDAGGGACDVSGFRHALRHGNPPGARLSPARQGQGRNGVRVPSLASVSSVTSSHRFVIGIVRGRHLVGSRDDSGGTEGTGPV